MAAPKGNQFGKGSTTSGRKLKFQSEEELKKTINAYFDNCDPHVEDVTEWVEARSIDGTLKKDENGQNYLVEVTHKVKTKQIPYTITGLALALGTSRQTLVNYEKKEAFFDTIKESKIRCEHFNEQFLFGGNVTGIIFNLKNNYNWQDKTEVDTNLRLGESLDPRQAEQLLRARTERSDIQRDSD
jgi:DNA-binding XRE family transcriptional regulator